MNVATIPGLSMQGTQMPMGGRLCNRQRLPADIVGVKTAVLRPNPALSVSQQPCRFQRRGPGTLSTFFDARTAPANRSAIRPDYAAVDRQRRCLFCASCALGGDDAAHARPP